MSFQARYSRAVLIGALAIGLGCSEREVERAADKAEQVGREVGREIEVQTERGVEQAREGVEVAREQLGEHVEVAREQLGRAGERLHDVSRERLGDAKQGLDTWLKDQRALLEQVDERLAYQPIEGSAEAIECSGEVCRIDATLIDRLAQNPYVLAREAVVVPAPATTDKGLRLSEIQPGSIPALLGLREGDVLISLNGTNLASLEAPGALDRALQGKEQATLIYEREGKPHTLTIQRVEAGQPTAGPGGARPR